jgi:hypothetical protein
VCGHGSAIASVQGGGDDFSNHEPGRQLLAVANFKLDDRKWVDS